MRLWAYYDYPSLMDLLELIGSSVHESYRGMTRCLPLPLDPLRSTVVALEKHSLLQLCYTPAACQYTCTHTPLVVAASSVSPPLLSFGSSCPLWVWFSKWIGMAIISGGAYLSSTGADMGEASPTSVVVSTLGIGLSLELFSN